MEKRPLDFFRGHSKKLWPLSENLKFGNFVRIFILPQNKKQRDTLLYITFNDGLISVFIFLIGGHLGK